MAERMKAGCGRIRRSHADGDRALVVVDIIREAIDQAVGRRYASN